MRTTFLSRPFAASTESGLSLSVEPFLDLTPGVTDPRSVGFAVQRRWKVALRDQRALTRKDCGVYIQYVGFETAATSRTYAFHVMNAPDAARDFTVTVQAEAFRRDGLRIQDGPGICFARLDRELRGEAQHHCAQAHLIIGESDINEYLGQHYPQKEHRKKE
jgi:hypothetical protein